LNGLLVKWLVKAVAVVLSVQSAARGGEGRVTAFWSKQVYACEGRHPACGVGKQVSCVTWIVWAAGALARPLTPSHPPYRLSKLWFSSYTTTMCLIDPSLFPPPSPANA